MGHVLEKELATKETEADKEETETPLSWFQRKHPHFFTPKVVQNRSVPLESPLPQPKPTKMPVTRKLTHTSTTFIDLCIDEKARAYSFKCKLRDVTFNVSRSQIMDAIADGSNSEWVRLPVGTEVLRLKRSDLRTAFHELEKL